MVVVCRKISVEDYPMDLPSRRSVFKCSPSMVKKWNAQDRISKANLTEYEKRLEREKKAALKELNRLQSSVVRDSGLHRSNSLQEKRARARVEQSNTFHASDADTGSMPRDTLALRREATYCKSLNQICNASETIKQQWDRQVLRQMKSLDQEYSLNNNRPNSPKLRQRNERHSLKCKSAVHSPRTLHRPQILSSKSASVIVTSPEGQQSDIPRYIRIRPESTTSRDVTKRSVCDNNEALQREEEEELHSRYLKIKESSSRRLSKTFSSPDLRFLTLPKI